MSKKYNILYDSLADVLYISKGKPKKASETLFDDKDIAVRKLDEKVIGLTIENFLYRKRKTKWENSFIKNYFPDFDFTSLPG